MATGPHPSQPPPHSPTNFPNHQQQPRMTPQGQQRTPPQPRNPFPPYQPPTSPETFALEQKRVDLLLRINQEIIAHLVKLQEQGKSGEIPRDSQHAQMLALAAQSGENGASTPKIASQEYILCMRCLQANMAWLSVAAGGGKPAAGQGGGKPTTLPGPAIMDAPTGSNEKLGEMYNSLKELFQGWRGTANAMAAARNMNTGNAAGANQAGPGGAIAGGMPGGYALQQQQQQLGFAPQQQLHQHAQQQQSQQHFPQPDHQQQQQAQHIQQQQQQQQQLQHHIQQHGQPQLQPQAQTHGQLSPQQFPYGQQGGMMPHMYMQGGVPAQNYGQPQMGMPPGASGFPPG